MEKHIIYLVGTKDQNGNYNKLCKCHNQFFLNKLDADKFFNTIPSNLKEFNAVFEVDITIDFVKKIMDGKNMAQTKMYMVKSHSNHNLCPVCESRLSGCHIGEYCDNEKCEGNYVDGYATFTSEQAKRFKDIIIK